MNPSYSPIEASLIGFGFSGRIFHSPFLKALPHYKLRYVVSSQFQKVKEFLPEARVEANFDTVLRDKMIELVVLATPNETHYPLAKAALEAGKNVVVDKPFTITSKEAAHLIEIAKHHQKHLTVFHNRRWDGDFLTIKNILEKGLLGDIYLYEAHYHRYRPHPNPERWKESCAPGSGTLYDLGSHLLDQALQLFGFPDSMQADVTQQRPGSLADDYFHLILTYNKKRLILKSSSLVYNSEPRFQIHGTKGSFIKSGIDPQEQDLIAGKNPLDPNWGMQKEDQDELLARMPNILKFLLFPATMALFIPSSLTLFDKISPYPSFPKMPYRSFN